MWKVLYLSEIVDHETMLQNNPIPIKILLRDMYEIVTNQDHKCFVKLEELL